MEILAILIAELFTPGKTVNTHHKDKYIHVLAIAVSAQDRRLQGGTVSREGGAVRLQLLNADAIFD